jgi:hypothetical protein
MRARFSRPRCFAYSYAVISSSYLWPKVADFFKGSFAGLRDLLGDLTRWSSPRWVAAGLSFLLNWAMRARASSPRF